MVLLANRTHTSSSSECFEALSRETVNVQGYPERRAKTYIAITARVLEYTT